MKVMRHRRRNHQHGDNGSSPVAQEQHHDERRQNDADQNGIAHAVDGFHHETRLIVERLEMNSRRQRLPNALDLGVHFIGHGDGVAVGLPVDAQQHRRLSVRGDDGVHRLHARRDRRHVGNLHRNTRLRVLDDDLPELFGIVYLCVHQSEVQLMVLLQQAGRVDEVGAPHRVENVGDRDACRQQLRWIRSDVEFRLLSSLHQHRRDAVEAVQARLQFVGGHRPELGLRNRVGGEAVADDGKAGEGQAMRLDGGRRRQRGANVWPAQHRRVAASSPCPRSSRRTGRSQPSRDW